MLAAVVTSAAVARRSRRFQVPGALLFLALGMLVGDDRLALISLDDPELVQNAGQWLGFGLLQLPVVGAVGALLVATVLTFVARPVAVWPRTLDGIQVDLIELRVTLEMAITDRRLADLAVPDRSSVTAVVRSDRVIVPRGDTVVRAGDVLLTTPQSDRDALRRFTAWARGAG